MKAGESENELRKRLDRPLEQVTVRDGIAAMCGFYADERVDGGSVENDRDMLLYQWGVDTFNAPDLFQLSITRQTNVTGESQPYRLALTFHFKPTDALLQIAPGNQWCPKPGELAAFQKFVESSPGFVAAGDAKPDRVELGFA